jgi:hypothetical protein
MVVTEFVKAQSFKKTVLEKAQMTIIQFLRWDKFICSLPFSDVLGCYPVHYPEHAKVFLAGVK